MGGKGTAGGEVAGDLGKDMTAVVEDFVVCKGRTPLNGQCRGEHQRRSPGLLGGQSPRRWSRRSGPALYSCTRVRGREQVTSERDQDLSPPPLPLPCSCPYLLSSPNLPQLPRVPHGHQAGTKRRTLSLSQRYGKSPRGTTHLLRPLLRLRAPLPSAPGEQEPSSS